VVKCSFFLFGCTSQRPLNERCPLQYCLSPQAYLEKAPGEVVSGGHLEAVLGVFQKLLASRAHDHEGFFLLNSLMEFLPLDVFRGYLPTVWTLLFRRSAASQFALRMLFSFSRLPMRPCGLQWLDGSWLDGAWHGSA
jgi:CAS/CSE protein, C-terminus